MKTRILFRPLRPGTCRSYTVRSGRYLVIGGTTLIHTEPGSYIGELNIQTPIDLHVFSFRLPWPFYNRTKLT
jgi:hypothetical protein